MALLQLRATLLLSTC